MKAEAGWGWTWICWRPAEKKRNQTAATMATPTIATRAKKRHTSLGVKGGIHYLAVVGGMLLWRGNGRLFGETVRETAHPLYRDIYVGTRGWGWNEDEGASCEKPLWRENPFPSG
jgi:hypothetical protein